MTRAAPYGSAAWRAWKHDRHWAAGGGAPADPLGAGNTALIAALGVTPLAFYDVRKNLTLSGSNVTSLKDVKGDGTYGPSFGTAGTAPTWDGTVIKTNGNGILLTSAVVTGLDLSTQLTVALIADGLTSAGGVIPLQIGAAANAAPWMRLNYLASGAAFTVNSSGHGAATSSTAASGTGNIRLIILTCNVVGTDAQSIEVPSTAKVSGTTAAALASGNQLIAIGGTTSATSFASLRFRALIAWTGGYTVGQASTLLTYATTYHGAVAA